jgi:DNA replication protein DnaD
MYALEESAAAIPDKRNLKYVKGILNRCVESGLKTREQAAAHDRARKPAPKRSESQYKPLKVHQ